MHRKEGFGSARLIDFAFRRRARPVGKLATAVGLDTDDAAALVATVAAAHAELVAERGIPTSYRLAWTTASVARRSR